MRSISRHLVINLIQDILSVFKKDEEAKTSFSLFIYIALIILVGQIIIVTFVREMFSVSPL